MELIRKMSISSYRYVDITNLTEETHGVKEVQLPRNNFLDAQEPVIIRAAIYEFPLDKWMMFHMLYKPRAVIFGGSQCYIN